MIRPILIFLSLWMALPAGAQTLAECQAAAERNYPLIRQYDLISSTADATVSNIQKGWLPQVSALAQATYQSDVTAWPGEMRSMLNQMGVDVKGLKKDQYRVGIDVSQTVYDGGAIRQQKQVARQQAEVDKAQNDVSLYQVRRRVNEMYFSLLLVDEQLSLNSDLQTLLSTQLATLSSMLRHGTAAESDHSQVKAELLSAKQQETTLRSQKEMLRLMLGSFCGIEITGVVKPSDVAAQGSSAGISGNILSGDGSSNSGGLLGVNRPELRLIDSQIELANARESMLDAQLRPRLSLFASGYYGYPGYNMFEDMMSHRWSLNGMVGVRMTWNIGALYTRKGDKAKLQLSRDMAENSREVFLFNNRLEQIQESATIGNYRRLMESDDEIIALRSAVRKAAESKLKHGIIDVSSLVKEINAENAAKVQLSTHEIELLKHIYDLRYTTASD